VKITGNAEALTLESDDKGFELHLTTSDGDTVAVNIHAVAFDFAESGGFKAFVEWANEGIWVRQNHAAMGILEPEDDCGYAPDSPKHPDWHSVHSDIWDSRLGK